MPHEIESKHKVASLKLFEIRLKQLGAQFLGTFAETDQFYDTPDAKLRRSDSGLRIRSVRILKKGAAVDAEFARPLVTFKGPRDTGKKLKVRPEVQTRVADAKAMGEIFAALGFVPTLVVRKRRSSWRLGKCQVELDELPRLGKFVEVEGPTVAAVQSVCRKLGLEGEGITRGYVTMLAELAEGVERKA